MNANSISVQAIPSQRDAGDKKQALYKLFAAYIHTIPLEELIALNGPGETLN